MTKLALIIGGIIAFSLAAWVAEIEPEDAATRREINRRACGKRPRPTARELRRGTYACWKPAK